MAGRAVCMTLSVSSSALVSAAQNSCSQKDKGRFVLHSEGT